jgi:SecD/SecF fusion protein
MKKSKGVAIIAIILACLIGLGYYTSTIMSATSTSQKKTDNKTEAEGIKLGLDLSGGVSITYRIKDKNIIVCGKGKVYNLFFCRKALS